MKWAMTLIFLNIGLIFDLEIYVGWALPTKTLIRWAMPTLLKIVKIWFSTSLIVTAKVLAAHTKEKIDLEYSPIFLYKFPLVSGNHGDDSQQNIV